MDQILDNLFDWMTPFRKPSQQADRDLKINTDDSADDRILCANCLAAVTTHRAAIEVNSSFSHNCANPYGFTYRIGCFATAPGCVASGSPTSEATWFPGYAWQMANCANCFNHLGWHFLSEEDRFFGLILAQLVL